MPVDGPEWWTAKSPSNVFFARDNRSGSEETQGFYQIVQNRLHFARHCPALSTRYPSKSLAILIPSEVGSNEKAFDLPQMFVGRRRPGND